MFLTDGIRLGTQKTYNSELSSQSLEPHPCTVWITAGKAEGRVCYMSI